MERGVNARVLGMGRRGQFLRVSQQPSVPGWMAWPGRCIDSLRQRGVITRTNVIWIQPNGVPQRTTLGRGGAQPRDDDGSLGYWGRRRKKFQSPMHFLDARI